MTQLRAVIYARYSSDLQREESIEDQIRECRSLIHKMGWTEVAVFSDAATSGAGDDRPGFRAMITDLKAGKVDVVVAEGLDRLSRDQEHIARFYKQIVFRGAKLWTATEGQVGELHIGLKGTMNALFLKDLADKVKRGQKGRVIAGRSPGGIAYGYRVVRKFGEDGEVERGLRAIHEEEASIVRRIFSLYADGFSARKIAKTLNAESIPSPRGGQWNASTIIGSRARRNGILWNEVYLGCSIYNRQTFLKDPDSGRRVPRINASENWTRVRVSKLQIVSQDIWQRVHQRLDSSSGMILHKRRMPRRLFSGLLQCGVCGGSFTVLGEGRIGCSNHRERASCTNGKKLSAERIENAVLEGLKVHLLTPDMIKTFIDYVRRDLAEAPKDTLTVSPKAELQQIDQQIGNLVAAIEAGGHLSALVARLSDLESRKATLMSVPTLEKTRTPIQLPDPALSQIYQGKVDELRNSLTAVPETQVRASSALRSLINRIEIFPIEGKGSAKLKVTGNIAAITGLNLNGHKTAVSMVAGARSTHPTSMRWPPAACASRSSA